MATITALRYTKSVYAINLGENLTTVTVTATSSVVEEWLESTLKKFERYRHFLVVGLGVQWTPDDSDNPPANTLQLCIGPYCLIFQLSQADTVPRALRKFLNDPRNYFVGFHNQLDRKKLEESKYGLKMFMNPKDLAENRGKRNREEENGKKKQRWRWRWEVGGHCRNGGRNGGGGGRSAG